MDIDEKMKIMWRRPTVEIVTEERLRQMFEEGRELKHYIGFEISGLAHLGTGLATALKIKDMLEVGIKPTVFLADYHTWVNRKLSGDLNRIQRVAKGYFKSVFLSLGLDESKVNYVLASNIYNNDYWKLVLQIGNALTLARVKRALTIMGRKESESNPSSYIIYPLMQAADIFTLDVDIAHAGMDQRKVHMLALDVADKLKLKKFVALHTGLISSLQGGNRMDPVAGKMSKSKPDSAIFVHDSEEQIRRKIKKAYCPEKEVEGNPVFDILKFLIVRDDEKEVTIERPQKFGGDITGTLPEIEKLYREGKLHPLDLKQYVGNELVKMLKPCREFFEKHKELIDDVLGSEQK